MKNWSLWTGLVLFGLMLFISFVGPLLPFVDDTIPEHRMRFYEDGSIGRAPFPPSLEDPLGTDREAGDLLSMLVNGAKDTLKIIVLITLIRYMIAIPMAFLASTKKGIAYMVSNGWYSLFGSIPTIIAAILLLEIIPSNGLDNGVYWKVLLIALIEVGRVSYIFAHEIYEVSQKEFVQASVTVGSTPFQLAVMHYLPSVSQSLVVNFFNDLARVTLLLGQLALFQYFIEHTIIYIPGGGAFQDESGYYSVTGLFDWPGLLSAARYEVMKAVWIPLAPAIGLTLLLLTFQLLSEGFRKLFERRTSSEEHRAVRRLTERVSEMFVTSKMAGTVTLVLFVVVVGTVIVTGVDRKATDVTAPAEEEAEEEAVEEVNEGLPFDEDKYVYEKGKLVATTVATTAKGGFYDKLEHLELNMEKKSDRDYETDTLMLKCRTIGAGRCELPVITFKEPIANMEEAYQLLVDHLPVDAVKDGEFQDNGRYAYTVQSSLLEESYVEVDIQSIFVMFYFTPEKTIEKVELVGVGPW
ncbi:ABC transporter permease subunit [Bacillus sp. REN16]|uniref:ABC transporter permease subunit n=1 Tax=Bacillus sp. REN16 TaxID=2887296 RepID=UPI001E60F17D|nr:ABC transporter permease subunit [Bacillus sp. REN16]MCC3356294.1 ABC transporter permease subunit [Bacillus sp. REN16]